MTEVYITRLFIPLADNGGVPFPYRLFRLTERSVRRKFGGVTQWGEVQGQWVSPSGRVDLDTHRVYEIAHAEREIEWWEEFREVLKERFAQEEIWIIQSSSGWMLL